MAAQNDKLAAIRCLVKECKANVEAVDERGDTPLHEAAFRDKVAAIRCLVSECKANVEAVDKCGDTPLHRRVVSRTDMVWICLLYTSPSPRDKRQSRMPSSA